jgi:hypothetical protein
MIVEAATGFMPERLGIMEEIPATNENWLKKI